MITINGNQTPLLCRERQMNDGEREETSVPLKETNLLKWHFHSEDQQAKRSRSTASLSLTERSQVDSFATSSSPNEVPMWSLRSLKSFWCFSRQRIVRDLYVTSKALAHGKCCIFHSHYFGSLISVQYYPCMCMSCRVKIVTKTGAWEFTLHSCGRKCSYYRSDKTKNCMCFATIKAQTRAKNYFTKYTDV